MLMGGNCVLVEVGASAGAVSEGICASRVVAEDILGIEELGVMQGKEEGWIGVMAMARCLTWW